MVSAATSGASPRSSASGLGSRAGLVSGASAAWPAGGLVETSSPVGCSGGAMHTAARGQGRTGGVCSWKLSVRLTMVRRCKLMREGQHEVERLGEVLGQRGGPNVRT